MNFNIQGLITGADRSQLAQLPGGNFLIHQKAQEDFLSLVELAAKDGIDLGIVSSYRDFSRQLATWNAKVRGEKAVLDSEGVELNIKNLNEEELLFAILRWNALPGTSRHHWGTDIDVFDINTTPEGYEIQLIPSEISQAGPYHKLGIWLQEMVTVKKSFNFFRPYQEDLGGVAPEWWHISHGPTAQVLEHELSIDIILNIVDQSEILLKETIKDYIEEICAGYVFNIHSFNN